jgi:outer membrane protein TolC
MLLLRTALLTLCLLVSVPAFADTGTDPSSQIYRVALKNYRKQFSPDGQLPVIPAKPPKAAKPTPVAKQVEHPKPQGPTLRLADLVRTVIKHNPELQRQHAEWGITQEEAIKAQAIFEPEFISSLNLERNSQRNTIEESLSRQLATTYSERNWDFSSALEGLLKTGAEFSLGYDLRHLSNSVTRSLVDEDEYQMQLGVSITQPLLKNFGVDTTTAAIRSAKIESQVSFQSYRQKLMRIVHDTASAYWEYHSAEQKLLLRKDSVRIAEQVLADNQQRHKIGKMTEVDVYEALAAVSSRRSLQREAEQEFVAAANRLRTLLSVNTSDSHLGITTTGAGSKTQSQPDKQQLVANALQLKPNYLSGKEKLKQADIKIAYAKNQRWPELDLLASYGLNGLGFSKSDSWRQVRETNYQSWGVGIEFRQPIFGGDASKSDYRKAELEKKRQLYELKNLETELINAIDTALHKLKSTAEQYDDAQQLVDIQKKLLDFEQARLKVGKSNSRTLLEKEDLYREARETRLTSRVNHQLAQLGLELASGSILINHGVEIMEIN